MSVQSAAARPAHLHAVPSAGGSADRLLAAMRQWADAAGGGPGIYLEISDGELTEAVVISADAAGRLAAFLERDTAARRGPAASGD